MKVINKSIPFLIKMILCISLFLIFNNVKADGYNYASFNWDQFAEKYKNYWSGMRYKKLHFAGKASKIELQNLKTGGKLS